MKKEKVTTGEKSPPFVFEIKIFFKTTSAQISLMSGLSLERFKWIVKSPPVYLQTK